MSEPKSKGRVTYWAMRRVGESEPKEYAMTASTNEEFGLLKDAIEDRNETAKAGLGKPVELVRVEVTPV